MAIRSYKSTYTISNELNDSETFYTDTTGVYVWGASANGGATTFGGAAGRIPDLNNVVQIYANDFGFAALLSDRSVYVWGLPTYIGTQGFITLNGNKITNVRTIRATLYSFAAILTNGGVVVWGQNSLGGDPYYQNGTLGVFSPPTLVSELSNIKAIYSTSQSFSALNENGEVWVWGGLSNQNLSIYKVTTATNVKTITGNYSAFAGLRNDGTVCVWGTANSGGEIGPGQGPGIIPGLNNVKKIYATEGAFAALRNDGSVFIWGDIQLGGSLNPNVAFPISYQDIPVTDVIDIYSNKGAFVAQLSNQVYIWGNSLMGGAKVYNSEGPDYIPDIVNVCSSNTAFAGITVDDRVYVWGDPTTGGSNIFSQFAAYGIINVIDKVVDITGNAISFTAVSQNGTAIYWGYQIPGNNGNAGIISELNTITDVFANNNSFLSVAPDETYSVWGISLDGGNNSQISGLKNFVKLAKGNLGTYAALEKVIVPPIPSVSVQEKSALSSTNASLVGIALAIILFVSFYLINSFIEDEMTKMILMLISFSLIVAAIIIIILFV
jgi:alpha-tubulin suppressor-like RCC1 family protein